MKWKQYLKESERTLNSMGNIDDLIHASIGINTEIDELLEAYTIENTREEIGDIFWYMAIFYRIYKLDTSPYFDFTKSLVMIDKNQCLLSLQKEGYKSLDYAKRIKFYGAGLNSYDTANLTEINLLLSHIINESGYDFDDILDRNINKLKVRYPEKFSNEKASNRDIESEYKVLV